MRRHLVLPARGVLLVSTDVHGNDADMAQLEERFLEERAREPETHWVVLGDIVHAPSADARASKPELYDYDDGSLAIVDRLLQLQADHPGKVHFVLGNHDHAHVGGPPTRKFHFDEAAALESRLSGAERERLRTFVGGALLAIVAPCGVLLTHGAPDASFTDPRALDGVPLALEEMTGAQRRIVGPILTSYGQTDVVARVMLDAVSQSMGFPVRVVIHGHDRDETGFFREGKHQLCPCIFGARRAAKRWVRLDLGAHYADVEAIREDEEIRRLYPHHPS